jgi:hypothetical protein
MNLNKIKNIIYKMGGILWKSQTQINLQAENYYKNLISNELSDGNEPRENVQLNIKLE